MRAVKMRSGVARRRAALALTMAGAAAAGLGARDARAQQVDVQPPLPNVLLLLDTSGSMEKLINGHDPELDGAACNPGTATTPNRWGSVLQSLTGSVQPFYSCVTMQRNSTAFTNTYQINAKPPYDATYHLPYRRPVSWNTGAGQGCVYGPGKLPGAPNGQGVGMSGDGLGGDAEAYQANVLSTLYYGTTTSCDFVQAPDGIIDAARSLARFGLMTFDSEVEAGTGVTGSAGSLSINLTTPFAGLWSYYSGWNTGSGSPIVGRPANCTTPPPIEVGARNPAAPPWEGRMVRFPTATADVAAIEQNNDAIQRIINATRTYGATPIAGMLADAKHYYWTDPTGPQQTDSYVQGSCRDQYIILLSDGAPNLDLRPSCEAAGTSGGPNGQCPFDKPEDIAAALASPTGPGARVKTFVIGFAVSQVQDGTTPVQCSSLVSSGTLSATCSDPSKQSLYGPCCTLHKIAISGGTEHAYFADTANDLNTALAQILSQITRGTTTRTVPAYSPVVASAADSNPLASSSLFLSSFVPTATQPWSGTIQRQRFVCTKQSDGSYTLPAPTVDTTKGDDFQVNLNSHLGTLFPRKFWGVQPGLSGDPVDATRTIRPTIAATPADGLGKYSGTVTVGAISDVVAGLTAPALNLTATSCPNILGNAYLSADDCKALTLNFVLGAQTMSLAGGFAPFQSRYDNLLGDIFHATPAVVAAPNALLRDESYQAFKTTWAARPTMVYAATNDGLLHAFRADVSAKEVNEEWAFLPPGVMPLLHSTYPANHKLLLDGAPIVKDVIFERSTSTLLTSTNWHTMLVAGFGAEGRGYYALDVTDPARANLGVANKGAVFRWQLTKMPAGQKEVFGTRSGTPAITTIFADPGDGGGKREIGVAILPGGSNGGPTSDAVGCDRVTKPAANDASPAGSYATRSTVRCWGPTAAAGDAVPGRSLAVVRIDTGEILRVFMRAADAPQALIDAGRVIDTPLDSPMTGIPVVYPSDPGAVAQKVFIGDADGTVWKFDLTGDLSGTSQTWVGSLFLDTVNQTVDTTTATSWKRGQPIQVAPVIALDRQGFVTVEVATGDQELYTPTGTNYVYSITEKPVTVSGTTTLRANVNWYLPLGDGERVSGPMAVFDGIFYWATFKANSLAQVCSVGHAYLYGRDYVIPEDAGHLEKGGKYRMPNPDSPTSFPANIEPATLSGKSGLAGKVIPGVSVSVSPACADATAGSGDAYFSTSNSHYATSNVAPGRYSLLTQVGGKATGSGQPSNLTYSQDLPSPVTTTTIDSWAGVLD